MAMEGKEVKQPNSSGRWAVKNVPPGEKVLFVSRNGNYYGNIAITDRAWYLGGLSPLRFDLQKARRRRWDEVRSIRIRSPIVFFFLGLIGVRVTFENGDKIFFADLELARWLAFGEQFGVRTEHERKWLDNQRTFRLRQFIGMIAGMCIGLAIMLSIARLLGI